MSDAQDAAAIQQYLKTAGTQVAAAVQACTTLDDATRARTYDLAGRVMAYVSSDSPDLGTGRALRTEFNAMVAELTAKGCGDLASLIAKAPPQTVAPPPQGTPNPLLHAFSLQALGDDLGFLVLLWFGYELLKGRK